MIAVLVEIKVAEGRMHEFMALMKEQARNSLRQEPECHQFDICTSPEDPQSVVLYEVYENRGSFEHHLQMPYFKEFDAATSGLIAWKSLRIFDHAEG